MPRRYATSNAGRAMRQAFRQLVSYALFGCVCSAADMLVFLALTSAAGIDPLVANVTSVTIGLTLSFFLNRRHTFHVTDRPARRYAVFICVGLCGMFVQELVIAALATHAAAPFSTPLVEKLVALVTAGLLQFFLNRTVTFRQR